MKNDDWESDYFIIPIRFVSEVNELTAFNRFTIQFQGTGDKIQEIKLMENGH